MVLRKTRMHTRPVSGCYHREAETFASGTIQELSWVDGKGKHSHFRGACGFESHRRPTRPVSSMGEQEALNL